MKHSRLICSQSVTFIKGSHGEVIKQVKTVKAVKVYYNLLYRFPIRNIDSCI